jgi:hypothetical protein
MENKSLLRKTMAAAVTLCIAGVVSVQAAPTFEGPASVPKYHPLCLPELKDWEEDGGAFDMQKCASDKRKAEVSKTSEGAYFAKRIDGEKGYMAYKPIGSLDGAMELLLVYEKKAANPLTSIYFLGRIPGAELTRDFLTTIEDGGDRCTGGVNDARLISASELEVDINATVRQMLTFLDESEAEEDFASLSFKPNNYQAFACAGTITKTYNLLDNQMRYTRVAFTRDESRKEIDKSSRCYDSVVANHLSPPRVLDMDQYQGFLDTYKQQCGSIR